MDFKYYFLLVLGLVIFIVHFKFDSKKYIELKVLSFTLPICGFLMSITFLFFKDAKFADIPIVIASIIFLASFTWVAHRLKNDPEKKILWYMWLGFLMMLVVIIIVIGWF